MDSVTSVITNDSLANQTMVSLQLDTDLDATRKRRWYPSSQALVNYSDSESDESTLDSVKEGHPPLLSNEIVGEKESESNDSTMDDILVSGSKLPLTAIDIVSDSDLERDDEIINEILVSLRKAPSASDDVVTDSSLEGHDSITDEVTLAEWFPATQDGETEEFRSFLASILGTNDIVPSASKESDANLETGNVSAGDISSAGNDVLVKNEPESDSDLGIGSSDKNVAETNTAPVKNEPVSASFENVDSENDDILVTTYYTHGICTRELLVCRNGVYTAQPYTTHEAEHPPTVADSEPERDVSTTDDLRVRTPSASGSETKVSGTDGVSTSETSVTNAADTDSEDNDQDNENSNASSVPIRQAKRMSKKSVARKASSSRNLKARTSRLFSNKAVKRLESEGKGVKIVVPKMKSYGYKTRITNTKPENRRAVNPNEVVRDFQCDQCNRFFSKSSNLTRHIQDVHNGSITQCAICGSRLSSARGWLEHQRRFHNKDHEDFYCQYCGKAFTCQSGRSNHYRRGCKKDSLLNN